MISSLALILAISYFNKPVFMNENHGNLTKVQNAYLDRNIKLLKNFGKQKGGHIDLIAKILLGDYSYKELKNDPCSKNDGESAYALASKVICYYAEARVFMKRNNEKYYALNLSRGNIVYSANKNIIDEFYHKKNSLKINNAYFPKIKKIKRWPNTVTFVDKKWSHIPFSRNSRAVVATFDGLKVPVLLDTGSTGIFLSKKDIAKFKLGDVIHNLDYVQTSFDGVGGASTREYYVKKFKLGPIRIFNAYVSVTNNGPSVVGIKVLKNLGKFTISKNGISKIYNFDRSLCNHMYFTRFSLMNATSYPFTIFKTNVGEMGLYFDSGETAHGDLSKVIIFASKKSFIKQNGKPQIKPFMNIPVSLSTNGKKIGMNVSVYNIEINHNKAQMLLYGEKFSDPLLTGSLGLGLLDNFSISYDFLNKKICVRNR